MVDDPDAIRGLFEAPGIDVDATFADEGPVQVSHDQAAAYGRFTGGFTRAELERYFFLDDVDQVQGSRARWAPHHGFCRDTGDRAAVRRRTGRLGQVEGM